MDNRPIGVFDSGLGGLTAVRELQRLLPGEDIIYFGDTGRVPYGGRSRDTIIRYARQDVAFLRTLDLKAPWTCSQRRTTFRYGAWWSRRPGLRRRPPKMEG